MSQILRQVEIPDPEIGQIGVRTQDRILIRWAVQEVHEDRGFTVVLLNVVPDGQALIGLVPRDKSA